MKTSVRSVDLTGDERPTEDVLKEPIIPGNHAHTLHHTKKLMRISA